LDIDGASLFRQTDGSGSNSGPAVKRFVGARIEVNPLEDTNPVGTDHVLTVLVEIGDGFADNASEPAALENNGIDDFEPAPNGETVTCEIISGLVRG
jgi:hypothetical protein